MADHGYKCFVPGCAGDVSTFHTLPTEKNCQQTWLMFVYNQIPRQFNSKLLVCSAHFTADSFSNLGQYQAGFAQRLILKKGAIPTILPLLQQLPQASTSQLLRTNDVGCQTDGPIVLSKATQLSLKTMRSHLRSKGVQVTVSSQSVAVGTTTSAMSRPTIQPFTWTPVKDARPAKRARVELEDVSSAVTDPARSVTTETQSSQVFATSLAFHKDAKFIVFEKCLLSLFESCPVCTRACNVRPRRRGTFIAVDQRCSRCGFFRQWRSQPVIGSTPVGNLQLSAAIYFSGASFLKMQKVFRAMYLKTHTYDAFRKHARTYIEPAVIHKWNEDQNVHLHYLSQNKIVILSGDMRADSPGHSAKYGSYTMMDLQTNNIVDVQLVQQSNEAGGSYHMEKEGLRRSLDRVEESGVKLDCIVTDRHPQIQKLLKDRKIIHYYDVWHIVKGLSKKVEKISREKDCSLVKKWHKSITNHLCWSATSSDSGPEKLAKWTSIINHIQDIHTHSDPAYPRCQHEQKSSKDRSKWFQPGSRALNRLHKVLINKRVLSDVEKLSPHYQTSTVESFHKVISLFAPKTVVFPFIEMLCRLYLAAMHFNENAVRPQVTTSKEKLVYKLLFPKDKKGGHTVKPLKTEPTFCYVINLMDSVFEGVVRDPLPYLDAVQRIPVPQYLSSQHDIPSMEEAVAEHVACFSRGGSESDILHCSIRKLPP
ncbi:uncharacterized protein LOC131543092 isoform X2 [Onychostoma macrolepis]|uniref:THAP-type domain-containing protein n=1 Tax=Onychostoma macrolepis TaxID=369639 RepID=A0A7J6CX09_9TELE|nr:uncharacterized protein LOC131543092 isoform X2 [Onychostoma macrolepis]KAF4111800.1 hypothetical protein G5714_006595 [Onychostoma macrolepis]